MKGINIIPAMVICLLIVFFSTQNIHSQESISVSQFEETPIIVDEENVDLYNFSSTLIEVMEDGEYYVEFWILPTKYPDGSYSILSLYLNEEKIGTITPKEGHWHAARIDGGGTIALKKGIHTISLATPIPEIPNVECMTFSLYEDYAHISSAAYEQFHNKASEEIAFSLDCIHDDNAASSQASTSWPQRFLKVPLKYSFYKVIEFTKGQDIFISSDGHVDHNLDMLYIGIKKYPLQYQDSMKTFYNEGLFNADTQPGTPIEYPPVIKYKLKTPYTQASSSEMQGYNWKGISEPTLNSSTKVATIRTIIPKTGLYLLRATHKEDGHTGLVNININGNYFYEDVPISFTWKDLVIPKDNEFYELFTFCDSPGIDDPMLFVYGAAADRIVGYNDDAPMEQRNTWGLSNYDSYLSQTYKFKTSGVSVSNESSSDPESECEIIIDALANREQRVIQRIPSNNLTATSIHLDGLEGDDNITSMISTERTLSIESSKILRSIEVFDTTGRLIITKKVEGLQCETLIHLPDGIIQGLYIVVINTESSSIRKKVLAL